jgi:predicted Zn-dependent protease
MRRNRLHKCIAAIKLLPWVTSCLIALCVAFTDLSARAQGLPIVRDTEIENTIRAYCAPLFKAAGLDIDSVRIRLVNLPTLNAFVAGGQNIFVHLGLLSRADNAGQVIGVLAHEIGHITGGHLARLQEGVRAATTQSIIAMILGSAAAIMSGSAEGLAGTMVGSQAMAQRTLFKYTQGMETAADQVAINLLEKTGQSSNGFLQFLEILDKQSAIYTDNRDPYASTHPLTRDRIDFVKNAAAHSRYSQVKVSQQLETMHRRTRGKINGYLDEPARTLDFYRPDDRGIEARYARIYAFMRLHKVDEALKIIDQLLVESPKDPFFHELKGDVLRDAGDVRGAIKSYGKAVEILPWAALIRVNLARMQLELNDPRMDDAIIHNVKEALRYETELPVAWRQLATVYGRQGKTGQASLALAEEALLKGDFARANQNAKRAIKILPTGSPEHIRAMDIENEANRGEREREDG